MICIAGNDSGKEVTWWLVPITLTIAAALAWAVTYLAQTGRIKPELKLGNAVHNPDWVRLMGGSMRP